ncbi:MAG: hypothetical protein AB7G47_07635 [Mycolicibacterium sp.]|uniref:hypothetical protein n=1 Tax=Mycolicibacterium sp. TaxID=2320850 RepID=UPI003D12722A
MNFVNASWFVALAGILVGIATLAVFRQPLLALRVVMDLLVAAGLLRLSVEISWTAIAGTALLIAVRRLLTRGLASDLGAAKARAHA